MLNQKYKSLLSDSALYALGIFLMKGIALIMLPVYTHYLSTTDYGRLEVLVVFSNILSIFLGFGLVEALCRYVGLATEKEQKRKHAGECLFIAMVIALVSFAIFHFYSDAIAALLPDHITGQELYLLGIALAVGGLINIPLAWLRITSRAYLFFKITMLKVVAQVLLTFYWLSIGWGITSILASGAVAAVLVAIILCFIQIKETGIGFSKDNLIRIVKYSVPIFIGGIATFALSGMDRWVLAGVFGAKEIAAYAIAIKFALIPTLLIQPFTLWWFPKRFSVLNEKNGLETNAHFAMLGASLSVLICGAIGFLGPFIIQQLTPIEYHGAINILPWLLICTLLKMLSDVLNLGCFVEENSQMQMNINLTTCGLGAILLIILAPNFGIIGALISLLFANGVRTFAFYYFSQRTINLPYKFGYLFTSLGVAILALWFGQMIEADLWVSLP